MLPFEVDSGDIEDDSFQPQDHKESLGEWTVSNALPITSRLHTHAYTCMHIKRHTHTSAEMRECSVSAINKLYNNICTELEQHAVIKTTYSFRRSLLVQHNVKPQSAYIRFLKCAKLAYPLSTFGVLGSKILFRSIRCLPLLKILLMRAECQQSEDNII